MPDNKKLEDSSVYAKVKSGKYEKPRLFNLYTNSFDDNIAN